MCGSSPRSSGKRFNLVCTFIVVNMMGEGHFAKHPCTKISWWDHHEAYPDWYAPYVKYVLKSLILAWTSKDVQTSLSYR